ncbi:LytR/AlgR family response regulator transcription factor [Enterococcus hulanensis]|uniref:LytR/AlgR family response regulator transcription factor n=1 Tax=Enterococcus hulanensis TaxID=2559929 RepID=UPI0010F9664A|nr:LytTR family DNA-binding domain-containing protein [Enterococcus hulanensis]
MIPVFICEDNEIQRKTIEGYINNYIMIEELDMRIEMSTDDPNELLNYLEKEPRLNGIYFLDVDLNHEINGIQLGAKIRDKDISGKIIFITTHSEMMYFTFKYKVEAMDYIIKDESENLQQRIIDVLKQSKKHYEEAQSTYDERLKIKIGNKVRVFSVSEVMFIETSLVPHKLTLHLMQSTVDFYGKINEVESLSDSFLRIHKSFVVNIKSIATVNKKKYEVIMENGEICPIAIRKVSLLNRRLG